MPAKHHLTQAEEVYYGKARYNRAYSRLGRPGVKITPELTYVNYGVIAAAAANAVATTQAVGAGVAFVLNGALVANGVATFPTPRNVVGAWTTNSILTITGTDEYGSVMVEVGASAATFTGLKAFKTITSIVSSASITAATIGTGVAIGLPYRADLNGLIIAKQANATDAATFVPAVTTAATGTSGDVRGTVTFAAAPNGTISYAALIKVADPSTKVGAYGVFQFGSGDTV